MLVKRIIYGIFGRRTWAAASCRAVDDHNLKSSIAPRPRSVPLKAYSSWIVRKCAMIYSNDTLPCLNFKDHMKSANPEDQGRIRSDHHMRHHDQQVIAECHHKVGSYHSSIHAPVPVMELYIVVSNSSPRQMYPPANFKESYQTIITEICLQRHTRVWGFKILAVLILRASHHSLWRFMNDCVLTILLLNHVTWLNDPSFMDELSHHAVSPSL